VGEIELDSYVDSSQMATYEKVVKKLGMFTVKANVTKNTTHVVTDKPVRTVKLLKGIVRGCWILSTDWVIVLLLLFYFILY
jgi:microcephalin